MRRILLTGLLALAGLRAAPLAAQPAAAEFVRVRDGRLVVGELPYRFLGVNLWFAANLGAEGPTGDRARLVRELDRLQALGVTNLRLMASSEGPDTASQRVAPSFQPAPGRLNEAVLRGLDFALAEMEKRGMRGVLVLNNFFQWSGGMAQYVSWATGEPVPLPEGGGHSWDDFQHFSARFYTLERAQAQFEAYVRAVTGRRNTVTGRLYRDDPTIMSWQLSNEPRGFAHSEAYVAWVDRIGAFLRREAPHQLISLGGEGSLFGSSPGAATQFERVSRSPYLDYLTAHVWIENWSWFRPSQPEATFDVAVGRTMAYLAEHAAVARAVNKPLVVEEFGVGRDGGSYDPASPTTYRDRFYQAVLEALYALAQSPSSTVAGGNLWSWSGEARPTRPGEFPRPGDPLLGDPPHEREGWYSIYLTDARTLELIRTYAGRMSALGAR